MDTLDCIKTRRSVRKFLDKEIPWDLLHKILESATYAPSSGNLQNWRFIIVTDPEKKHKIAEASLEQYWMETAPVLIVVCSLESKVERFYGLRGKRLYAIQNCAAAIQNMLLAAHSLGLASCWVGAFDEEIIAKILGIDSSEARPQAIIPIGYPDESPTAPDRDKVEQVTYFNKWKERLKNKPAVFGYYGEVLREAVKKQLEKVKSKIAKQKNKNRTH